MHSKVNFVHYKADPAHREVENMRRQAGIWRSYDDVDGLSIAVGQALQDQRGYLWVGDNSGLHRYDGTEFVSYTTDNGLASNIVITIYEDRQGKLWIGTSDGISCFDDDWVTNYTTDDGLIHNRVGAICEDHEGRLWFGTPNGVSCFDGKSFTNYTTSDGLADYPVLAICEDHRGLVWIGTEGGVSCFDGKHFRNYNVDDGLVGNVIWYICEDNRERLWFSTGNGVSCFDGKHFTNYTTNDGLANNNVWGICEDHQGRLWFGTRGGVSCFDGEQFTNYTTQHGLLDDNVCGITQDREGLFWFSSTHSGLSCFDPRTLRHLTSEPVTEVLTQGSTDRLWFSNVNKLCCFFEGRLDSRILDEDLFDILEDSKNRLWLGIIGHGLYCYDPSETVWSASEKRSVMKNSLGSDTVLSLLETRDGTIWVGTANPGHLCRFDGETFETIPTPHRTVLRLLEDNLGNIWIIGGIKGGGVSCYDGTEFVTYTMEDGLPSNSTHSIVEDNAGHIWIGTQEGLCRFDGEDFTVYGKEQGLFSLSHKCAAKDASGQLWFGTLRGGVYRTDGEHFQVLTTEDELPSNSINGLLPQPDGSMIIGTYRGIVQYQPTASVPPLIEIREVIADRVYQNPGELKLTTTEADLLTISYHGLSFATRRMRYSYILEGYDDEWHDTWDSRVRYESLPVGEYTFKVIAINRDLVCSDTPAVLGLTITHDRWSELRAEYEAEIGRMRQLLEINRRVSSQQTLSDTARAIVESLRELGFDRAGVWIRHEQDAEDEALHGLWGTNMDGEIYDNTDELWPAENIPADNGYYVEMDGSILEDRLEISESSIFLLKDRDEEIFRSIWGYHPPSPGYYGRSKQGDNICLCIATEDGRIVVIAVDNHITGRLIDETQANLLGFVGIEMAKVMASVALRESLAQSEAKSRAILDVIPDLMFRITRDGVFLDYKADDEDKLYVPGSEIIGNNAREILPPEFVNLLMDYIHKTLDSGLMQHFEFQLPVPKGLRDYEARLVISGENEVLTMVRNITERKQADIALKESERKYRNLIEMAPDGIVTTDMKGFTTSCNTATLRLTGYSRDEYIGKHFTKLGVLRKRDIPKYAKLLESVLRGKPSAPIEFPYHRKDGELRWGEAHLALLEENGRKSGIQAILRDITDRKLAEEREKEYIHDLEFLSKTAMEFVESPSEDDIYQFIAEKLKELVGDSIVIICGFDSDSDSFYVRSVLGLGRHTRTVLKLLGQDSIEMSIKSSDAAKFNLASGKLVSLPGDIYERSGGSIPKGVSRTLEKILNLGDIYSMGFVTEGKPFGAAFICTRRDFELQNQDIVETFINQASMALQRRQAEEHIKASLAEKVVLLKEIHHRVKNNLQIISSLLNLQSGYISDEHTLQMFKESQNRVRSMALIHEKLYGSSDLARIDFADYIRDLANYLFRTYSSSSRGIKLGIDVDDVLLDIDRAIPCGLIVNELVSNSLKHGFPSSEDRSKGEQSRNEICVELHSDNHEKLTLIISDNGVGFPKDLNFQKTESLGLQLVNTLTDQLEGDIELDRRNGTAFKITFAQPKYERNE